MQPKLMIEKKTNILIYRVICVLFLFSLFFSGYFLYNNLVLKDIIYSQQIELNAIDDNDNYIKQYMHVSFNRMKNIISAERTKNQRLLIHNSLYQLETFFELYYPDMSNKNKNEYIRYIHMYSEDFNIPPLLIASIIKRESNFDPKAEGSLLPSGYRTKGLGQIHPKFHMDKVREMGYESKEALFIPEVNIYASVKTFHEFYERRNHDIVDALYGYVGGRHTSYVLDVLSTYVEIMLILYNGEKIYENNIIVASKTS